MTVIRGCASPQRCNNIDDWMGEPSTMVETSGCPLRMFFEPRASFLEHQVQYFAEGEVHTAALQDLVRYVRKFKTIALHYRTGDSAMTKKEIHGISHTKLQWTNNCLGTVDSFIASRDSDTRPVRWIIASDNERLRDYFRLHFPEKTIILMAPPEHIAKTHSNDPRQVMINTMSEFYLLSQADELVTWVSKMRMSAFSKFAWLYGLKSQYYAIRFRGKSCHLMEATYDGNTSPFPFACSKNPHMGRYSSFSVETHTWKYTPPRQPLSQPHLGQFRGESAREDGSTDGDDDGDEEGDHHDGETDDSPESDGDLDVGAS